MWWVTLNSKRVTVSLLMRVSIYVIVGEKGSNESVSIRHWESPSPYSCTGTVDYESFWFVNWCVFIEYLDGKGFEGPVYVVTVSLLVQGFQ